VAAAVAGEHQGVAAGRVHLDRAHPPGGVAAEPVAAAEGAVAAIADHDAVGNDHVVPVIKIQVFEPDAVERLPAVCMPHGSLRIQLLR
jgi:hypothetical protein